MLRKPPRSNSLESCSLISDAIRISYISKKKYFSVTASKISFNRYEAANDSKSVNVPIKMLKVWDKVVGVSVTFQLPTYKLFRLFPCFLSLANAAKTAERENDEEYLSMERLFYVNRIRDMIFQNGMEPISSNLLSKKYLRNFQKINLNITLFKENCLLKNNRLFFSRKRNVFIGMLPSHTKIGNF